MTTAAVAALLIALAGCAGGDEPEAAGETEPAAEAESEAAQDEVDAEHDPLAVCAGLMEGDDPLMDRVPDLLIGIEDQLHDPMPHQRANMEFDRLLPDAPPEMAEQLEVMQAPFAEISEVVADGGGSISMDTSGVEGAAHELTSLCVEAGYALP